MKNCRSVSTTTTTTTTFRTLLEMGAKKKLRKLSNYYFLKGDNNVPVKMKRMAKLSGIVGLVKQKRICLQGNKDVVNLMSEEISPLINFLKR